MPVHSTLQLRSFRTPFDTGIEGFPCRLVSCRGGGSYDIGGGSYDIGGGTFDFEGADPGPRCPIGVNITPLATAVSGEHGAIPW